MPWTIDEIDRDWMQGQPLPAAADVVVRAFDNAERVLGREWVVNTLAPGAGGFRRVGFFALWPVYWFGIRIESVLAFPGTDGLLQKLRRGDASADAELTAIYLLHDGNAARIVELEPDVAIGDAIRHPDFRIREGPSPWIYSEVTQLNASTAGERAQRLLAGISHAVIAVDVPFILDVVVDRVLTEPEERDLISRAQDACHAPAGHVVDVGDYAKILVKSGDPAVAIPAIVEESPIPRLAQVMNLGGADANARQVIVRVAYADERAELILRDKSRQLPANECGLLVIDIAREGTAMDSWPRLVPPRFTPNQHTRVAGVLLFHTACMPTAQGMCGLTMLRLIPNPHARVPLPPWVTETVERLRTSNRRLMGQPI